MSWFMDIFGNVYGGGVFCAVATMGINVRELRTTKFLRR